MALFASALVAPRMSLQNYVFTHLGKTREMVTWRHKFCEWWNVAATHREARMLFVRCTNWSNSGRSSSYRKVFLSCRLLLSVFTQLSWIRTYRFSQPPWLENFILWVSQFFQCIMGDLTAAFLCHTCIFNVINIQQSFPVYTHDWCRVILIVSPFRKHEKRCVSVCSF